MRSLHIGHAEDPDGILAKALAMRYHQGDHTDHILVRYDRMVEQFQNAVTLAQKYNYDSIEIADIDLNIQLQRAAGENLSLLEKLSRTGKVLWFDHHDGTKEQISKLAQIEIEVHHDPNQCAALLYQRHFSMNDPYEQQLAKIAQAHDYKNDSSDHPNIQIGDELEKVIAVANETLNYRLLLDLSIDLANETCFDRNFQLVPKWQHYARDFDLRAPAAYLELDKSAEIVTVGNHKILFGYSPALLSPKNGPIRLRRDYKDNADLFVCLFKSPARNHLVLKNESSPFPVIDFSRALGGGGRGNGGGFTLDYDITSENYNSVKQMLFSQIERHSQK